MTREHCEVKLPGDIERKRQQLEDAKRLYDMPEVGMDALRNEEDEINRLKQRELELLEKQKARIPAGDDKLSMYRTQATQVASKKAKAQDRFEMLSEDVKTLEEDLADKRAKLGHSKGPVILKGQEFKDYAEKLKDKAKTYKSLKGKLSSVIAEKGILSRTEDLLKHKHGDHSEFLAKLEQDKGISGAASLQDRLEDVSEKTSQVRPTPYTLHHTPYTLPPTPQPCRLEDVSEKATQVLYTLTTPVGAPASLFACSNTLETH